jgi:hypothetical protein
MMSAGSRADSPIVKVPGGVHSQVVHAAARLESCLQALSGTPSDATVLLAIKDKALAQVGNEGFQIRSVSPTRIEILANTDAGATNGIYALLMAVRKRQLAHPFAENWDLQETPRWPQRRVAVACYVMGLTKMTPETWTFDEWRSYIDLLRLFNINYLSIMNLHLYHPDVPDSYRTKWRIDVYRQVIDYAHEQGMKVSLMFQYNAVPLAVFWEHPEWRGEPLRGYFGCTLSWPKAKTTIMKYATFMMDYLAGLDGIEVMVTEPLGWCLSDEFVSDPAAVFLDAVREYRAAFRERNPQGDVIFWNWLLGHMPGLTAQFGRGWGMPPKLLEKLPEVEPRILREMPKDVFFLDLSSNQMNKVLRWGGDASKQIEVLQDAPEKGFQTINFMFFMDREFGMVDHCNIFPKPFLDLTVDEYEYTKTVPVIGVSSYRLAPPGQFLSDFFFMRKSWNPDLTRQQLVDEAAGFLTSNSRDKQTITDAIEALERYWLNRDRQDLLSSRDAFQKVTEGECIERDRTRDGLVVLATVDDYARAVRRIEQAKKAGQEETALETERDAKLLACFSTMKQYPLFQGFTSEGIWEGRAIKTLLRPHMEMWANYINHGGYYD